jgi:alkylation response protein AidB-like acyl-CoA dehydrogenase
MVGGLMENVATGAVEPHLALVPRSDFRIEDTWFTVGLKGSGSKDLCVEGVLVPDYRVEALSALGAGVSRGVGSHEGMIFRIPFMATFGASFAVAALGMADGMLAAYTERLKRRHNAVTGAKTSDGAPSYMRLAQSSQEVHAASLILAADWADYEAHGRGEKTISQDTLVHWRANQAFAIRLLRDAVNRLYEASGGGAGFLDQPIQRYWRDINMASGHVFADYDAASQVLGRHLLGLAPDPSLL